MLFDASMFQCFSISPCLHFSIWAGTIAKPVNPTFHPVNSTMSSGGRPRGTIGHARWGGRCKGPIAPTSKTSASPAWHIEVGWPTAWSVTVRAARTYTNGRFYPWRCWSARKKKKAPTHRGGRGSRGSSAWKNTDPSEATVLMEQVLASRLPCRRLQGHHGAISGVGVLLCQGWTPR